MIGNFFLATPSTYTTDTRERYVYAIRYMHRLCTMQYLCCRAACGAACVVWSVRLRLARFSSLLWRSLWEQSGKAKAKVFSVSALCYMYTLCTLHLLVTHTHTYTQAHYKYKCTNNGSTSGRAGPAGNGKHSAQQQYCVLGRHTIATPPCDPYPYDVPHRRT
jgi:hypothetical protein